MLQHRQDIMLLLLICAAGFFVPALAVQRSFLAFGQKTVNARCTSYSVRSPDLVLGADPVSPSPGLEPGNCDAWRLPFDTPAAKRCFSSGLNSVLMMEVWVQQWAGLPNSSSLTNYVYALATQGRPNTLVSVGGGPMALTTQPALGRGTFFDSVAMRSGRSYHRMWVNLTPEEDPRPWFITLANLNPSGRRLESFSLAATCLVNSLFPCPAASPALGRCSSLQPLAGLPPGTTLDWIPGAGPNPMQGQGVCSVGPQVEQPCICAPGFTGYACSTPFLNLSQPLPPSWAAAASPSPDPQLLPAAIGAPSFSFAMAPRTWVYFWLTVPIGSNPVMLVEVSQTPGSRAQLDPILVVQSDQQEIPDLADINFASDTDNYVDIPQTYASFMNSLNTRTPLLPGSVWVAIFNNAPLPDPNSPPASQLTAPQLPVPGGPPLVTLRVQASSGGSSMFLCPRNCSGRGRCVQPPNSLAGLYSCRCFPGFSGPMCEGSLTLFRLDSSTSANSSGLKSIEAGEWDFYQLLIGSSIRMSGTSARLPTIVLQIAGQEPVAMPAQLMSPTFSTAVTGPGSGPLYMLLSPFNAQSSVGEAFWDPSSYGFTSSVAIRLGVVELARSSVFMLGVFNSDAASLGPMTYNLTVALTPAMGGSGSTLPTSQSPSPPLVAPGPSSGPGNIFGVDASDRGGWYVRFAGGLVGSAGLAVAIFFLVRLLQHRLNQRSLSSASGDLPTEGTAAAMEAGQLGRRAQLANPPQGAPRPQLGVPKAVVSFFPVLRFTSATDLDVVLADKVATAAADLLLNAPALAAAASEPLFLHDTPSQAAGEDSTAAGQNPGQTPLAHPPAMAGGDVSATSAQPPPAPSSATATTAVEDSATGGAGGGTAASPGPAAAAAAAAAAVAPPGAAAMTAQPAQVRPQAAPADMELAVWRSGSMGQAGVLARAGSLVRARTGTRVAVEGEALAAGGGEGKSDDGLAASRSACAVCLLEYEEGELLRALLPCGHAFHMECIDPWLASHDTCPMCRCDLIPAPFRPLAHAAWLNLTSPAPLPTTPAPAPQPPTPAPAPQPPTPAPAPQPPTPAPAPQPPTGQGELTRNPE